MSLPFANDIRTRAKRKKSGFSVLYLDNVHKNWISGEDVNGMTVIVVELSDHAWTHSEAEGTENRYVLY